MSDAMDPQTASVDGLIHWLGEQRHRNPDAPLSALLAGRKLNRDRLVDVACIDLVQRRRMGHAVCVEDYLNEFPSLQERSQQLDLIDAELCVASELGQPIELDKYTQRFPDLADQVQELIELESHGRGSVPPDPLVLPDMQGLSPTVDPMTRRTTTREETTNADSDDFSVELVGPDSASPVHNTASLSGHPVDVPDWFVADQCVANSPGRWLIRGRDSVRGITLAMKVTELPTLLSHAQSTQLLDACELASQVRNPAWVAPRVAAIQQRHLGVIRPWVFARPWDFTRRSHDANSLETQLRQLASVAFAVESAHRIGATHGGLHVGNLMLDHEGNVQVLDGASSRMGLQRWLHPAQESGSFESFDQRRQIDVRDMIQLVAAASVELEPDDAGDLLVELRNTLKHDSPDACGLIGQVLMARADGGPPQSRNRTGRPSWRQRFAGWLTRQSSL